MFQVVDTLRIGGAERMAVDVSNGLSARGWDVHLIPTRELGPLEETVDADVHITCLQREGRFDLGGLRRFRRMVRELRPEIVHAHGWSSLQFCTAGLAGIRNAPALVLHDHQSVGLPVLPRSYRISAWPLTAAHIAVDQAQLTASIRTRQPLVSAVVANGIPLGRFALKQQYGVARPARLVMTANVRHPKAQLDLIDAIADLAGQGTVAHIDLVGSLGNLEYVTECRQRIAGLGLADQVTFLGAQSDVGERLAGYDLGVLSSRTESGPIALIEYMAAGLPFVVTDVGEIPATLPEELRRWVVPPRDTAALAAKIRELLGLAARERAEVGALGRAHVEKYLSINRTIDGIEAIYDRLRSLRDGAASPQSTLPR